MERENTLDTDAVRDLTDRERLVHTRTAAGNNDTLEMLDTLLVAFDDADRYVYRVTGAELGYILTELSARNSANCVFHDRILVVFRSGLQASFFYRRAVNRSKPREVRNNDDSVIHDVTLWVNAVSIRINL